MKDIFLKGCPDDKTSLTPVVKPFWDSVAEPTVSDGVIYKGMHIVIPLSLRGHRNNHAPFQPGDEVRMAPLPGTKERQPAVVINQGPTPRSYIVQSRGQQYRRNRKQPRAATHSA